MSEKKKIVAYRRRDDGELFTLNPDGETYSLQRLKDDYPGSLNLCYLDWQFSASSFDDDFEAVYREDDGKEVWLDKVSDVPLASVVSLRRMLLTPDGAGVKFKEACLNELVRRGM